MLDIVEAFKVEDVFDLFRRNVQTIVDRFRAGLQHRNFIERVRNFVRPNLESDVYHDHSVDQSSQRNMFDGRNLKRSNIFEIIQINVATKIRKLFDDYRVEHFLQSLQVLDKEKTF